MPTTRKASDGIANAILFSPPPPTGGMSRLSTLLSSSPRPSLSMATTPASTPQSSLSPITRSPDSLIMPRSAATSPHSPIRKSPLLRSTPIASNRRRYSEQTLSPGSMLHHSPGPNFGSLVGSYEESLLSGRMSSLPSKPLIFDAELGVLGLGKCRPSLKCPPHANFTFPAHFYSLEGASDKEGKVSPGTPYVGTIDVEGHYMDALLAHQLDGMAISSRGTPGVHAGTDSHNRSSIQSQESPAFPGYRIPAKGQIQLVIKNPNLTAVKLFLVPYDFTDMPPGTKTFIRQKSHVVAASPSVEVASGSTTPTSPSPRRSTGPARETLRYAVHLQFCALPVKQSSKARRSEPGFTHEGGGLDRLISRRRSDQAESKNAISKPGSVHLYLHKNIRVVFAARVPDSTEKLRVVTETPGGTGQSPYSTFLGASDEWKEAKRVYKIHQARFNDHERKPSLESEAHGGAEEEELEQPAYPHNFVNLDPNGERWFAEDNHHSKLSGEGLGVDIPLTSRSPWRGSDEQHHHHHPVQEEIEASSVPTTTTSFPTASRDNVHRPFTPFLSSSTSSQQQRSPFLFPPTSSPSNQSTEGDRAEEDRIMLERWHASLAIRPPGVLPSRPSLRSRLSSQSHFSADGSGRSSPAADDG